MNVADTRCVSLKRSLVNSLLTRDIMVYCSRHEVTSGCRWRRYPGNGWVPVVPLHGGTPWYTSGSSKNPKIHQNPRKFIEKSSKSKKFIEIQENSSKSHQKRVKQVIRGGSNGSSEGHTGSIGSRERSHGVNRVTRAVTRVTTVGHTSNHSQTQTRY